MHICVCVCVVSSLLACDKSSQPHIRRTTLKTYKVLTVALNKINVDVPYSITSCGCLRHCRS